MVLALGREAIGAELPSAGLWLNASKPEALLETTMTPFLASDDRRVYCLDLFSSYFFGSGLPRNLKKEDVYDNRFNKVEVTDS